MTLGLLVLLANPACGAEPATDGAPPTGCVATLVVDGASFASVEWVTTPPYAV